MFHKLHGKRLPVILRALSGIKAQQIVDQPLEAPGARACRASRFCERGVAEGAVLLWHEASLTKWRKALPTRRATVAQAAAMANPSGCVRRNGRDKRPRRCLFVVPFSKVVSKIIRTSMAVPFSMNHQDTQTPPSFAHSRPTRAVPDLNATRQSGNPRSTLGNKSVLRERRSRIGPGQALTNPRMAYDNHRFGLPSPAPAPATSLTNPCQRGSLVVSENPETLMRTYYSAPSGIRPLQGRNQTGGLTKAGSKRRSR